MATKTKTPRALAKQVLDIELAGLKAVRAIKDGLDPKSVMNPGKILPGPDPLREWGLTDETIQTFNKAD